jgi:hypothetical protein
MVAKTVDENQVNRALIKSYDLLLMADETNLAQAEAGTFVSQSNVAYPATTLHAVETLNNTWIVLAIYCYQAMTAKEFKVIVDWMDRPMRFLQEK